MKTFFKELFAYNHGVNQQIGKVLHANADKVSEKALNLYCHILNGHQICHGGLIFTLADSSFAFACNSRNLNTVASGCSIEFLRPVHGGDVLTAEAVEQTLNGRTGIYDIRVTNRAGDTVALFRGKSAQIKGNVIPHTSSGTGPE